jgi:pyruvate-formate lyase-activating enzyme
MSLTREVLVRARRRRSFAWLQYELSTRWSRLRLQLSTRLRGKRFGCAALAGRSDYNICVNSDLTVSCNCQDWDGSGHLGSLRDRTLAEILAGETASRFRRALAAGTLPTANCAGCSDLRILDPAQAERLAEVHAVPKRSLMVENTVLCNLSCGGCFREKVLAVRERPQMDLADVERVAATVAEHGIEGVSFFNLGEPFLSKRFGAEIDVLLRRNPRLRIDVATNGALIDSDEKREAAMRLSHVLVSIDGDCQESASRYQAGIDFEAAYRNMAALVALRDARGQTRPIIEWKYVVFRWNDRARQIERAIALARQAGVDRISFWPAVFPLDSISWRYRWSSYFRTLGDAEPYGRLVRLRGA